MALLEAALRGAGFSERRTRRLCRGVDVHCAEIVAPVQPDSDGMEQAAPVAPMQGNCVAEVLAQRCVHAIPPLPLLLLSLSLTHARLGMFHHTLIRRLAPILYQIEVLLSIAACADSAAEGNQLHGVPCFVQFFACTDPH